MTYCFDIDGTLCSETGGDYDTAEPHREVIDHINALFNQGDHIILYTARGTASGIDWRSTTEMQLKEWGVLYHELHMGKPEADFYIDDRAINVGDWR